MRQSILVLIAVFSISILNAQRYINIGSSKSDVKKVMGEPTSIRNYESLKKEIWGYGEYGLATVTFKNGKLFEYSNMDGILKIGERSTIDPENPLDFDMDLFNSLSGSEGNIIGKPVYNSQIDELQKYGLTNLASDMDSIPKIGERSTIDPENPLDFDMESVKALVGSRGSIYGKPVYNSQIDELQKYGLTNLASDMDYSALLTSLKSSGKQPNNLLRYLLGILGVIFCLIIVFTLIRKKKIFWETTK